MGKEGGIQDDRIEADVLLSQGAGNPEKVASAQGMLTGEGRIEGGRTLCQIQEPRVEIGLQDGGCSSRQCGDAQAARVSKGIKHSLTGSIFQQPLAQVAGIEIKTGILVHLQIQGVPDPILADSIIQGYAEEQTAPAVGWVDSAAGFE